MQNLSRTLRTIRPLKPCQYLGMLRHVMRRRDKAALKQARRSPPPFPGHKAVDTAHLPAPAVLTGQPGAYAEGRFTFLGETVEPGDDATWNPPGATKLWLYNLHYFNWLWCFPSGEEGYLQVRNWISRWIDQHELAAQGVGWEPYPVSLRLQNWIVLLQGRWKPWYERDESFAAKVWRSAWHQAQWLAHNLEYRLLANHLFENAVALFTVGAAYEGPDAVHWKKIGERILRRQLKEQQLADGFHVERAPMYHLRFHYTLELARSLAEHDLQSELADRILRSRDALASLCHPDGDLALLNDSAFNIYTPASTWLKDWPGWEGAWSLPETGYYGWRDKEGNYLVCDAGPLGPDYNPGHGHADLFSYELSIRGHRAVVDAGVFDYEPGEMREYVRSTAAHNTVTVNDADQDELWGVFRVGRRTVPRDLQWEPAVNGFLLNAWHDGFSLLPGTPLHRRVMALADQCFRVVDDVQSGRAGVVKSRVHLHPSCRVMHKAEKATVDFPGGTFTLNADEGQHWQVEESWYCPQFGYKERNICLYLEAEEKSVQLGYTIAFS